MIDGRMEKKISIENVYEMLDEFARIMGAKKLSHPYIIKGLPHNPGITGFLIIDRSHISIHTFEEQMKILIDIFNCYPFNPDEIFKYLSNFSFIKILNTNFVTREI
jgi:S-adenosylmethionine decarboxylase